ncbi:MAG: GDP-mannose 4,6-dehydratase [Actinomycetota bacterium]|nr:GDP-mannose 4,6-dehydratase [Actinomycetota bacterium]MDQ3679016.1 GDP-mannose 4,6-dehydratase [Actinomycetota bacterium]
MRALVTGGSGFVGSWLRAHLEEVGDDVVAPGDEFDLHDPRTVHHEMASAGADAVYHLAGLAHVGRSWDEPVSFFEINALGTLHVLDAARRCRPVPRVLVVSSAEVYGTVNAGQLPLDEETPMRPVSPYAASKAAAEMLGIQAHLGWEVPVIRARPFNHLGPGQSPTFAVPALAGRILEARRTGSDVLRTGNLSARRDFTDVRDVVRAYRLLVEAGEPGAVYNVCSGRDVAIEKVVTHLLAISGSDLRIRSDPDLMRPIDVPVLRGDPSRLRAATGWVPVVPLEESLEAVLDSLKS